MWVRVPRTEPINGSPPEEGSKIVTLAKRFESADYPNLLAYSPTGVGASLSTMP
jgi:hypothetical protein